MIALSGVQWGSTNPRWSIGLAFHAITADLEVMAQHELGRRAELQKSNMLYRGDLYAALSNLAQRCRALGEVMPRILLANEKPEGGAS